MRLPVIVALVSDEALKATARCCRDFVSEWGKTMQHAKTFGIAALAAVAVLLAVKHGPATVTSYLK